jgi:rhodanese-related sulfurtransferase
MPTARATFSAVREYPAADPSTASRHYLSRLAVETDVSDVIHDLSRGTGQLVVIDVRAPTDFAKCHVPGAVNLPHRLIGPETVAQFDRSAMLVTYCWGPSCNSATKAAAKLAQLGFQVKEMLGGIEYWRLEGGPVAGSLAKEAPLHWQHDPS